jgi:hypothetical protein
VVCYGKFQKEGLKNLMFEPELQTFKVLGNDLNCLVCGGDTFWQREAKLNTGTAEFFGIAWANTSVACIVCANSGFIHWFHPGEIQE